VERGLSLGMNTAQKTLLYGWISDTTTTTPTPPPSFMLWTSGKN